MKPLLLALALCCLSASYVSAAATELEYEFDFDAEFSDYSEFSGAGGDRAELLIVSPFLKNKKLGDSITIYELDGRYYLPLFAVSRLLEIGIRPSPRGRGAHGFVIEEARNFVLDVEKSSVELAGKIAKIDSYMVRPQANDIYVTQELVSLWLPVDFTFHRLRSSLEFIPRQKLPIQLRWELEEKLAHVAGPRQKGNYVRLSNEYRLWDGPFLDETLSLRSSSSRETFFGHSTYLAADAAYAEVNAYASGNQEAPFETYRVNVGRRDPYGQLLGPLRAREVQVFDVFSPRIGLLWPYRQVRGGVVSSYPLGTNGEAAERTFEGDLPPGWTVELYRGEFLLDFRRADLTGRYVFQDVPLEYGYNRYRLVFYGPYGQRREEVHYANLSDTLPGQGDLYYHLSGGQDLVGGTRALAQADYGLTPQVTSRFGFAHSDSLERANDYALAGLRGALGPLFATGDLFYETRGGVGTTLGGYTRVGDLSLLSEYDYAGPGFESEVIQRGPLGLLDSLRFGGDMHLDPLPIPVSLGLLGARDRFRLAHTSYAIIQRTAMSWQHLAFTHRFEWRTSLPDGSPFATAGLTLSRSLDVGSRVLLLGDLQYNVHPEYEPTQVGLRMSSLFASRFLGFVGLRRAFRGDTSVDAGVAKEFDQAGIQVNAAYAHPGEFEIMTVLTSSLSFSGRQQQLHWEGRHVAKEGNILVRAFLDTNQNGRWDAGERPVPDVTVFIDGVSQAERTGRNGTVLVRHLRPYQPIDVTVSGDRIGDPSWKPMRAGVAIVPRPGRSSDLDFPFEFTGEIEGTVYQRAGSNRLELSGAPVELVDARGNVIDTQWSAYDGFYLFTKVRGGAYTVRVSSGFADSRAPAERKVAITEEAPVVYGADLVIQPK